MSGIDFTMIVNMFAMEGMVALGKIKHPATQTMEKNLEHAQFVIELLQVLSDKTQGNLVDTERKFLEQTLSTLRLNYVHESSADRIDTDLSDNQA